MLQLGRALDLPRAETDRLLLLAGHAGDWTRLSVDSGRVREQLGKLAPLLAAHDPLPALVSDPDWCVAWHNRGARALFRQIRERAPHLSTDPVDLRQILADEQCFNSVVANRDELLSDVVTGLYQLEPDPASFGNARSLLAVLPTDRRGRRGRARVVRSGLAARAAPARRRAHALARGVLRALRAAPPRASRWCCCGPRTRATRRRGRGALHRADRTLELSAPARLPGG